MTRTLIKVLFAIGLVAAWTAAAGSDDCQSTVTGELRIEHLNGSIVPGDHVLRVWLPPGYGDPVNAGKHYPVLYMMDGQNLFDVCPSMNHAEWNIDETLTRLIRDRKVEPLIVVGIDSPDDGPLRASELVPFADWVSPFPFEPHGEHWPHFLAQEVLPFVASRFRVKTGRVSTAVGGASYGGIASLYALITLPHVFGLGLIESPWTTVGNGELVRLTHHLTVTPIRVAVGVGDNEAGLYAERMRMRGLQPEAFNRNLVRDAKAIAQNLKESGGDFIDVKLTESPQGMHDENAWRERFAANIEFLFPFKQ